MPYPRHRRPPRKFSTQFFRFVGSKRCCCYDARQKAASRRTPISFVRRRGQERRPAGLYQDPPRLQPLPLHPLLVHLRLPRVLSKSGSRCACCHRLRSWASLRLWRASPGESPDLAFLARKQACSVLEVREGRRWKARRVGMQHHDFVIKSSAKPVNENVPASVVTCSPLNQGR